MSDTYQSISEIAMDIAKQKENLILESLGDLVTKGLLIIEQTEPVVVGQWNYEQGKYIVSLKQKINLALKDKEYIQKLEKENQELRNQINTIKDCFKF